MNPKIEKLQTERTKVLEKLSRLQSRREALDEKITELENLEIIGVVREVGMSPEQLAAFLHRNPAQSPLPVQEVTENG